MKSTAIFATKTDRDNRRSKDSGILAGLWSLPAVQYSWCELWLGVFAMVMFPHRLQNNDNNELFVFSIILPTMSKFAWYVCMCMNVYIHDICICIYMDVLMTATSSAQSLSVIMSVKKKWQKIPQWGGKMVTLSALCRWMQFCLLLLTWRVVGDLA